MHQVFLLWTAEVHFPDLCSKHWLGLTSHGTLIISDMGLKLWGFF